MILSIFLTIVQDLLIHCYCRSFFLMQFVLETWKFMEEKGIVMNKRCYMSITRALSKGGYLDEAFNWLAFLGDDHQKCPVLPMCNIFLNGCGQMQRLDHANYCLDLMEHQLTGKSEVTYWELLKLAVWQQSLSTVHEIWKECTKYYNPSIILLRKFIWSYTRLRDLASAYKVLQYMVALAFKRSDFVNTSAEGKFRSSRLDIPIPSNIELAIENTMEKSPFLTLSSLEDYLPKMETDTRSKNIDIAKPDSAGLSLTRKYIDSMRVMKVLRWSFSDVIHACAQSRNSELAEQLFLQMHDLGLQPSEHTYDGFIKALVSGRGVTDGMEVVKTMEKSNLKPYNATLATLSIGCSKNLELDLAETFLDQIVESSYAHPFNELLAACDVMDEPERAVRVLAKMKHLKLKLDIRTYELLFSLFGNVNAPYEKGNMLSMVDVAKRINAIETDMLKNGVQHSHLSMVNLLKALGTEGMIRELIQYLHVAENLFCHANTSPGTAIYNTVLHSLVEANESHMAIEVFRNMKLCGLPPDAATYNIMIDCCSITRCFRSALALVSMMLRDGFCPQICTYTALIKILLANEDFSEALNLLDQAHYEGIQSDVLLINTFLEEAYLKGRIDMMESIVERMHQEKIQPDPSTCHYVFSAYVDRGFHSTAMEALQVLSMRMISEESTLIEKRAEFEDDFVYNEDLETESRILKLFKGSEQNLAAALLNLRWCAIVGYSISWLPNESAWAKRLNSSYGPRKAS
ncbi:PREDICTED: pentatricopeptide repeat-containing protein At1g76280 isoform X2 [Nelumbo nucifera]|uniref:Pentatricopeptide repeat-containing protein At1g76280 isoform X2 n=1 Tax=Nelumbo nucifera TaxID=4432 RepID=A0A1U8Q8K0_NELNU|nr:PREDICTED: pentatricopeptide repeat-containing protein At1g76280 isoform X2 [Nelumbo nucifera]